MSLTETIKRHVGWCPHNPAPDRQMVASAHQEGAAFIQAKPQLPRQGSREHATRTKTPEWMATIAIIVLFGTLFFGGSLTWLFFVLAVLVACLTYWYLSCIRGLI